MMVSVIHVFLVESTFEQKMSNLYGLKAGRFFEYFSFVDAHKEQLHLIATTVSKVEHSEHGKK